MSEPDPGAAGPACRRLAGSDDHRLTFVEIALHDFGEAAIGKAGDDLDGLWHAVGARKPHLAAGRRPGRPFARLESHPAFLRRRSEEHTSELQSLMRISYAVFCLKKNKKKKKRNKRQSTITQELKKMK